MSVTKYNAFLKAVECESLTGAANELGYTQPGISHMILSLEREMGFPLLIRKKSGITPTANAKKLIPAMQQIVNGEKKLQETARDINGIKTGSLKIGSYYSILMNWMPDILHHFTSQYPGIEIQLLEGDHGDMMQWLSTLKVDMALMSPPVPEGYEFIPLAEDPVYAVLPSTHPYSNAEVLEPSLLMDTPFIIPSVGVDEEFLRVVTGEHLKPQVRCRVKGDAAMLNMIAKGLGVSFMAGLLLEPLPEGVRKIPLTTSYCRTLGIGIASMRYASPAAQEFIFMMQEKLGLA
jgi:DNA-binding transcriptional LysR family regulator